MGDMTPSNHDLANKTALRQIVSEVRSGTKNKTEAFNELKSILQYSNKVSSLPTTENENTGEAEVKGYTDSAGSAPGSGEGKISKEERRLLINKLLSEKNKLVDNDRQELNFNSNNSSPVASPKYNDGEEIFLYDDLNNQNSSKKSSGRSFTFHRSADDSNIQHDARSNRIAQTESIIRQEMFKECTFRPNITKLPAEYGPVKDADTPFIERVNKWHQGKVDELKRRQDFLAQSEMVDCTFRPKINRSSEKAVKEMRGDVKEDVTDRLFKINEISTSYKEKFMEEELQRERQEEDLQCTFKPSMSTGSKYADVTSKFDAPLTRYDKGEKVPQPTFTPKVKGVKSNMVSAKLYVSTNVVDRLSRGSSAIPLQASTEANKTSFYDVESRKVVDAQSYMSSMWSRPPGSPPKRASSAPKERTTELTAEQLKKKKEDFQSFISRQNQTLVHKKQEVDKLTIKLQPNFKPKVSRKSMDLMSKGNRGEFLDRVEKYNLKKETEMKFDPEQAKCTFKPALSKRTDKLRVRSVDEMSSGDLLKRVTNQRMMRMRTEQEEMAEYTFKPEISAKASRSKGALKLHEDPSQVLDWYKNAIKKREDQRVNDIKSKNDKELKECTFSPEIIECPAYIKRIAKSMAIVKSARKSELDKSAVTSPGGSIVFGREDWK